MILHGSSGTSDERDERLESLSLIQTGCTPPIPFVMLAPASNDVWPRWLEQMQELLVNCGLIAACSIA